MTEEWLIKISMLVDGELSQQEASAVLNKIQEDKAARAVWVRYQAASDLMRSEANHIVPASFSEKITDVLQSEPTVLAPVQQRTKSVLNRTTIGAIAASLFVFAVVVGNLPEEPLQPVASVVTLASNHAEEVQPAPPEKLVTHGVVQVAANELEEEVWIQDEQLNDYLMKHRDKSHSAGAFGVLPFARVVSYGNGH